MEDLVPKSMALELDRRRREAKDWHPHAYQERGLRFMLEDAQCGLLADPGTGKTSTTLAALKMLFRKRLAQRALIVAPLRAIYDVWPLEMVDWRDFHDMRMAILHGDKKETTLRALGPEHRVALINFEGLAWLYDKAERRKLLGADVLVVDESSKMKNTSSVRFRIMRKQIPFFKRRYILTGSPRPRSYMDLFGQVYLLDRGATLGAYITHYRNQYFFPTGYQMREWELLPGASERIDKAVAPLVMRVDAEDYLKMPGKPDRVHWVALPDKAAKEYDSIEKTMMSKLFDAPMVSAAAARSRLCQMANGAVYLDPGPQDDRWPTKTRPVQQLHTAKIDALVDLYEELQGEPLLVAIGFHHDVAAIRKALGADVPCLNSAMTRAQGSAIIDEWNRGRYPILLGHPASMGHGLNLQKCGCRHVAYFDIPDDYDLYDQFYRRVWRQGNRAEFVFRHHFVARGTVDVAKMANLRRKGSGQKAFLDAMREYAKEKYGPIK